VSDLLKEKTPIRARHIRPGQGQAVELKAGQLLQIETVKGKQVADFVAFSLGDTEEYLSTAATRSTNANIVPQVGMTLYSNRRQPMFEIVEDTVGRHDMLYICCDPQRYEMLDVPGHANCREALTDALTAYGVGIDRIPSPINWFMNVSIQQRGELEIREPLAEEGDYVLLRALKDVVAAVSACPQDISATNAGNPTDLQIRVFRDEPLPPPPVMPGSDGAADVAAVEPAVVPDEVLAAEAAEPATAAPAEKSAGPSRPARLSDSAEATVVRVEAE
jgi:uncharacterized protein YcgI (DUF1989 family)